jgi:acyl carrier protein
MKIREKLKKIFIKIFKIKKKNYNFEKIKSNNLNKWDSIGHINLVLEIEKEFKIKLTFDEIINSSSFEKIIEILEKK